MIKKYKLILSLLFRIDEKRKIESAGPSTTTRTW